MEINPIRIYSDDEISPQDRPQQNNDEITLPRIEEKEEITEKCEDDCMPDFDDIIEKEPEIEEE